MGSAPPAGRYPAQKEIDVQQVKYILTVVRCGQVENRPFYDFLSAEAARLEAKKDPQTETASVLQASAYDR